MSLESFIDKHHLELLSECWKFYKNKHDVWDLYQDASIKMYNSFHTYNQEKGFLPWARRIILTTYVDQARAKERELAGSDVCHINDFNSYGEEGTGMEESAAALLKHIPEDEAQLLESIYVDGLSQASIAKIEGVNKSTIHRRLQKAKQSIREAYYEFFEYSDRSDS